MANTLLTISLITKEALHVLENQLQFTRGVDRQFDPKFGVEGAKIGTTLNVRKPPRYLGRTGQALSVEDATETQVPVVLNTQFGVDIQFSSQDLALSIDEFSQRFIAPAIAVVSNKIDTDGLALYKQVYNSVGTPGTVPATLLTYLNAGVKLDNEACPMDGNRYMCITPQMQATIVDALKGLFQSASAIADQYRRGAMGYVGGWEFAMDQNVNTHTTGEDLATGTPLVDGASQTGTSLVTDGWSASTANVVKEGDVFTIDNVNSVNPQSRQSTGQLRQFVVRANATSGAGAGAATITISPAMTASGAQQTIDALAANDAAINPVGGDAVQSPQGMGHHRDAFTLACADLPLPRGVDMAARMSDKQLGLSIRMIRDYDINTDNFPCRLDVLFGWAALRPELAVRAQA